MESLPVKLVLVYISVLSLIQVKFSFQVEVIVGVTPII